ncbi:hypothetical protein Acr_20g0009980 [Actinidia rufa]|uniref:Uncharacterized protein n=1 Tax=Actinidia rufa TaxID=165716 RepID=A0A7J0GEF3_9ERIC|nr:hypothetical protein Acr_20g0009980 [Actinidia rufa]
MADEANQLSSSPKEDPLEESPLQDDPSDHGRDPKIEIRSPLEKEFNFMTQDDLNCLRELCSFPFGLVPNMWRSIVCVVVVWRYYKRILSLNEFRCLYRLFKNPKPDSGWLYFKVRSGNTITKGYPNNVKGWKRSDGDNIKDKPVEETTIVAGDEAMSKRINLKKLAQKGEESKGESSTVKRVVVGEKCPEELSDTFPNKKGKSTPVAKEKEPRPKATMLRSSTTAEKLLESVIPPFDKEEVEKLDLDRVVSKFFHIIGQAIVVRSSLANRSREMRDEMTLQQGRAASLEGEMARAQNLAAELEKKMAKLKVQEQQIADKLARAKAIRRPLPRSWQSWRWWWLN